MFGYRDWIEVAGHVGAKRQCLEFGSEQETMRQLCIVQRLDPEMITRQMKPSICTVPNRESEHPVEGFHHLRPLFLPQMNEDLGVRIGSP